MSTDLLGHFGRFGGRFVPEALIGALDELSKAHQEALTDPTFQVELMELHRTYTGRPSIITEARRFSKYCGGANIFLKREDLNHTALDDSSTGLISRHFCDGKNVVAATPRQSLY